MDRDELLEILADDVLFEVIAAKVEAVNQVPAMLENIGYIEDMEDVILQTERCEITPEPLNIVNFTVENEKIFIEFEMQFLLWTWHDRQPLLRITATAQGKCAIPDIEVFNWEEEFDEDNENIFEIIELKYTDTECDDLRAL